MFHSPMAIALLHNSSGPQVHEKVVMVPCSHTTWLPYSVLLPEWNHNTLLWVVSGVGNLWQMRPPPKPFCTTHFSKVIQYMLLPIHSISIIYQSIQILHGHGHESLSFSPSSFFSETPFSIG